jgi:hypothetical protein
MSGTAGGAFAAFSVAFFIAGAFPEDTGKGLTVFHGWSLQRLKVCAFGRGIFFCQKSDSFHVL